MTETDTKTKILDAAEKLFTSNGFAGTSLRAVIKEAGVNTASVHYHFGSKEGLIEAVLDRWAAPVNAERLEMLDELETRHASGPLPVEGVVEAFLDPVFGTRFEASELRRSFPRLMGRVIGEPVPNTHEIFHSIFGEVFKRFSAAFARALPDLSLEEIHWRMFFMVGAMAHAVAKPIPFADTPVVGSDNRVANHVDRFLIRFVAAGMRAPTGELTRKDNP